ncbi:LysR family transcriptional regulator [Pseudoxanthomonas sp.]|jgi:transcriptional regulator, LysR family|uniref:LysR family transcriptional regulator n=1 Tax=Pseudoxanthomonas sp. TaxID=1871049 RepID=UPI002FE29FF6
MDKIDRYRAFLYVAELGSFIAAAKHLRIPRASVSFAVQQLEASLGTRLFHRTTRRVSLTADGEELLERARIVLVDIDALERRFLDRDDAVAGRLKVDAPSRIARRLIAPGLPQLLEQHPHLELHLSSTDRFVDPVAEGIDCVVRVGEARSHGKHQTLRELGALDVISCASPDYLDHLGIPENPPDLREHCIVGYDNTADFKPGHWEYMTDSGQVELIEVKARATVDNAENYIACGCAGLGIIQVPRFDVQHLLDAGRLIEILRQYQAPPLSISLIHTNDRRKSRPVSVLAEWLSQLLAPHTLEGTR